MREIIQNFNQYNGYDFRYRIKCDNCGEYIRTRNGLPREFLTCGEDELCAIQFGWFVGDGLHLCPRCKDNCVEKGIMP